MKRLLSGIRVSGKLHLGHYFGAIRQWVAMQKDYESFAFLADLHGLTTPFKPGEIAANSLETAKLYVSLGIDPQKTNIFVQSHIPEHTELSWILSSVAKMGELARMTQYKEKADDLKESASLGLFAYPVLMAADILIYKADIVPVGEDQKQHVEFARDWAQRFNHDFGNVLKIPEVKTVTVASRLKGLDNPAKKMSKSAPNPNNYINLLDSPAIIRKKVKVAVTDSESVIKYDPENKPAISNLMTIYTLLTNQEFVEIEKEFADANYGQFKEALAEKLVSFLQPVQEKYESISDREITEILREGAAKARPIARETLSLVKAAIGLLPQD